MRASIFGEVHQVALIESQAAEIERLKHTCDQHKRSKQNLSTRYGQQCAELTRLREVVEKLPKTADGVPVVPGATVYHCRDRLYPDGFYPILMRMSGPYCCGESCWDEGCQSDHASGRHVDYAQCFSTREAAQAAAAKGDE